jgi:hypothetical protein
MEEKSVICFINFYVAKIIITVEAFRRSFLWSPAKQRKTMSEW